MDLFTKRCGCGAIYRPAVATSRACAKCEANVYSAARQIAVAKRLGETRPPVGGKAGTGNLDPVAKGAPKEPPGWEWAPIKLDGILEAMKLNGSSGDAVEIPHKPVPQPAVNGALVPPGTPYGPKTPAEWLKSRTNVSRRGNPIELEKDVQYIPHYTSDGQIYREKRTTQKLGAASIQDIMDEVRDKVRRNVDPYQLSCVTIPVANKIVSIIEVTLSDVLPAACYAQVVEYSSDHGSFKVRARVLVGSGNGQDLTWEFG